MQTTNYTRAKELFLAALEQPADDRVAFLTRECGDDDTLRADVQRLLDANDSERSPLDSLAQTALDVFQQPQGLPETIGRYRVRSLLGEGGMGVVYLAERPDLETQVAIKVLRDAALSPQRREWFLREERLLAQLNHPGIARLFDAEVLADGTPYFVMEYVAGEPITTFCNARNRSIRERLAVFRDACVAVGYAHRQAILHRDLKPSNMFVSDGPDGTPAVKLLDFGIARELSAQDRTSPLVTASRFMTPAYAAPEQLAGGAVGVGSDVFALGVVLYELLTGELPFDPEARATAGPAAVAPPERPSVRARRNRSAASADAGTWSELDVLCLTAMHEDPQRRYQTAEALLRDLDHLRNGEPLDARADSVPYRTRKFVQRHRGAVFSSVAVIVGAVALTTFYTVRLTAARDAAVAEAARTTRLQQFLINLFQGGPQGVVPGDSLRLATVVQNGIREARGLATDSVTHAEVLTTLGIISEQIGVAPQADSLYRQAIAAAQALYGPNHPETVRATVRRAALLAKLGKPDSAIQQLTQLDSVARRVVPADHPALLELDEALGKLLAESGRIPDALVLLERAVLERARSDTTSREYASALRELGNALAYGGRYQAADSVWRRSMAIEVRLSGPDHPNVGFLLTNLGSVASMRGDLPTAERELSRAVAISAAWFGEHHWLTAAARLPLAQTYIRQGRFADAVPVLRGMIADYNAQPLPTGAVAMNLVQGALGHALEGLGDLNGARAAFDAALVDLRAQLGPNHMSTLLTESSVAGLMLRTGKVDSAIAIYRSLLQRGTTGYGAWHPDIAGMELRLGRALFVKGRSRESIDVLTAGLHVLDSAKAGRPDDMRTALASLDSAYVAIGDTAKAEAARARLAQLAR